MAMASSWRKLGAAAMVSAAAGAMPGSVRGVAPADQVKYAGADSTFKCFAGGASLPFSAVNDDFCDCADGSDEPGTSACGGKRDVLFYCPNEHSVPAYLYPSRVNDGVCDCCDGSDEWRGARPPGQQAACVNTCVEEGKKLRKEREGRETEWRKGLDRRKHLMDFAISEKRKSEELLAAHRRDLPGLEAAEAAAAKALDVAWEAVATEKRRLQAAAVLSESSTQTTDAAAESAATSPPPSEEETPPPAAPTTEEEAAPAAAPQPEQKVVSEYTKWMEGAEQALDSVASDAIPGAGAVKKKMTAPALSRALVEEEDYEDEEEDDADFASPAPVARPPEDFKKAKRKQMGFFGRNWASIKETVSGFFGGATRSPAERERDRAEDAQSDAAKALKDKRKQIDDLDKRVNVVAVDGDDKLLAYHSLNGKCITKKLTEYKYEVCFFKNAKQDSTSIGNWAKWEAPGVALFTGGQHCPGALPRSLRVVFRCGPREEIEDVTEPSRCAYQTTIMHPAACTDEPPEGADATAVRPRMPTDEL